MRQYTPTRDDRVDQTRRHLLRTENPRLQMFILVLATGAVGFFTSAMLLRFEMRAMWLRYPLAVAGAYACFLLFVGLWVSYRRHLGTSLPGAREEPPASEPRPFKKTGRNFDIPNVGDMLGLADEGLPILLIILVAGAVVLVSAYLVVGAPGLFAEVAVDGAVSAALYRRLQRPGASSWLSTAVRQTVWPFVAMLVGVAVMGAVLAWYAPGAATISEVLRQ